MQKYTLISQELASIVTLLGGLCGDCKSLGPLTAGVFKVDVVDVGVFGRVPQGS